MRTVQVIPTLVTLANGWCGLLAIYKTIDGHFYAAGFFILLAMVFDMLDGKIARMAGTTSRLGAQLDSLSDAISFGAAPAVLIKSVVETEFPGVYHPRLLAVLTAVFALGAIVRLARYNVEHSSGEGSDAEGHDVNHFDGVPTPGAAGVLASIVFLAYEPGALFNYKVALPVMPVVCALLGFLMVSRVPYVHFGKQFLQGRRGFGYLFLVILVLGLLTKFPEELCAVGFLAYAFSGPVRMPFRKKSPEPDKEKVEIPDGL